MMHLYVNDVSKCKLFPGKLIHSTINILLNMAKNILLQCIYILVTGILSGKYVNVIL